MVRNSLVSCCKYSTIQPKNKIKVMKNTFNIPPLTSRGFEHGLRACLTLPYILFCPVKQYVSEGKTIAVGSPLCINKLQSRYLTDGKVLAATAQDTYYNKVRLRPQEPAAACMEVERTLFWNMFFSLLHFKGHYLTQWQLFS